MNSMGNMGNMNSMNSMSNMGGMNSMGNMGGMNSMGNMGGMNNMNSMGNMGSMGMSGSQPSNYKTSMCKNVMEQGHCFHGDSCNYAHSSAELRSTKPTGFMNMGGPMGVNPLMGAIKRKWDLAKTALCTNFATSDFLNEEERCL